MHFDDTIHLISTQEIRSTWKTILSPFIKWSHFLRIKDFKILRCWHKKCTVQWREFQTIYIQLKIVILFSFFQETVYIYQQKSVRECFIKQPTTICKQTRIIVYRKYKRRKIFLLRFLFLLALLTKYIYFYAKHDIIFSG